MVRRTPSRAVILTGKYSHLNGVTVFSRFNGDQQTVPARLPAGGSYTARIGKWHLSSDPQGFDSWEILPGQGVCFDPVMYTATAETTYSGRYATDVLTDRALDVPRRRPRNKPFFLMLHHKAPHRPWEPDRAHASHSRPSAPPSRSRSGIAPRRAVMHGARTGSGWPPTSPTATSRSCRRRDSPVPHSTSGAHRHRTPSSPPSRAAPPCGAAMHRRGCPWSSIDHPRVSARDECCSR
ncbi:MAG: sulfatase-like hydrolase/transferase [Gemmatimonas sp.]|jgi:arylsulfatase A-like enzyme|uniref:sulfatase-like hydrolase/transferase n=1 Tax=Gemmatimonas sp. TaxID=1962908 RepID=UPI00391F0FA8